MNKKNPFIPPRKAFSAFLLVTLPFIVVGCGEQSLASEKNTDVVIEAKGRPPEKNYQNDPCSPYNLGAYKADTRPLNRNILRIGMESSDSTISFDGRDITILGFLGQAEKYYNYYVYSGIKRDSKLNETGAKVSELVKTKVTVCFKQKVIAVYRYHLNTIGRGKLEKHTERHEQFAYKVGKT